MTPSVAPSGTAPDTGVTKPRSLSRMAVLAAVAKAPTEVWTEEFDTQASHRGTVIRLDQVRFSNNYTADAFWLDYAKCNGVVVDYTVSTYPDGVCASSNTNNQTNARVNVRRLADVLGQVGAGLTRSTASTQRNRVLVEWTDSGQGAAGANRVFQRTTSLGLSQTLARYYAASIDIAEASCGTTSQRSQLTLALTATGSPVTTTAITACTDSRALPYTSPLPSGFRNWVFGGDSVRAGRFTSDTALLIQPNQLEMLRPTVRNLNNNSGGNDFAIDNLRIVDVTPTLGKAFSPATITAGEKSTLTFTITNTSELAAKPDMSFTDALPRGLVVAPNPAVSGTCRSITGAELAYSGNPGATSISLSGFDFASGEASCTATIDVTAAQQGTYANGSGNLTTMLDVTQTATLTVLPKATLTLVKSAGSATATAWTLSATPTSGAALTGATGSAGVTDVVVAPNSQFQLSETGGPATYVQTGWSCKDKAGASVAVASDKKVTIAPNAEVTCISTSATARITLIKQVLNPPAGVKEGAWTLTATPAALTGLTSSSVLGSSTGTAIDVRPGHAYTLSEATTAANTPRTWYQTVLQQCTDASGANCTEVGSSITAPAVGQNAYYRFVNAQAPQLSLPLTGGPSADAFLIAGGATIAVALVAALIARRRRRQESVA